MAKPPSWMWVEMRRAEGVWIVHIRLWHPYVWFLFIKGRIYRLISRGFNKKYFDSVFPKGR